MSLDGLFALRARQATPVFLHRKVVEMPPNPTVSVLIPTFNREAVLRRTVVSVLNQTLPVAEVIIADDGSVDDTRQLIEKLAEESPDYRSRLRYFYQPNQGKSIALNTALGQATGDWIAFNDSDDVWCPDKLARQFDALWRFPDCSACVTDASYVDGDGNRVSAFATGRRGELHEIGRIQNARFVLAGLSHGILMPTIVVRRETMDKAGLFDPDYRVAQDVDFLFRLSLHTGIVYVNEPLVEVDRDSSRVANRLTGRFTIRSEVRLKTHERMYEKWHRLVPDAFPDIHELVARELSATRSALANEYLLSSQRAKARRALMQALRTRFTWPVMVKLVCATILPLGLIEPSMRVWRAIASSTRRRSRNARM